MDVADIRRAWSARVGEEVIGLEDLADLLRMAAADGYLSVDQRGPGRVIGDEVAVDEKQVEYNPQMVNIHEKYDRILIAVTVKAPKAEAKAEIEPSPAPAAKTRAKTK